MSKTIPVIDLFAGPGGLGEGFSSLSSQGKRLFELKLSVEKDVSAHQTLLLRSVFRSFEGKVPDTYYDYITGKINKTDFLKNRLIAEHYDSAQHEAKNATLGETPPKDIDKWISAGIKNQSKWVLIGGPPCQAYSLAGRSKMMNLDIEKYQSDARHLLYKEYLRIIKKHSPPVFIMENVKGILSSKFNGELIFKKIIDDLRKPQKGLEYEIRSLTIEKFSEELEPRDFIIESEQYGIPQARHRVILFGIRKDLARKKHRTLEKDEIATINDVLGSMPHIRSKLSKEEDSFKEWFKAVKDTKSMLSGWNNSLRKELLTEMERNIFLAKKTESIGNHFLNKKSQISKNPQLNEWLTDSKIGGIVQHETRSHMRSDIQRYFFLSNYAKILGRSPKIRELPQNLLPNHQNASSIDAPFQDRFRVQLGEHPSTTIVSHISKDGHYYIHPDPSQARSLTVREAARIQTFPDNYYFEGNKTSQYSQVGNAVPPLLAKKIAAIVHHFLND
jgi:DNA (cytosine-5)-methyltransferase 1